MTKDIALFLRDFVPEFCLYHYPCQDGSTAAAIVRSKYPNVVLRRSGYVSGLNLSGTKGTKVLVVDVDLTVGDIQKLDESGADWRLIDHHQGSQMFNDNPRCLSIDTACGARLTHQALYPGQPEPEILQYIDDYDRWTGKLPQTRAIVAALNSYGHDSLAPWEARLTTPDIPALLQEGEAIMRDAAIRSRSLNSCAVYSTFAGFENIPLINVMGDYNVMNPLGNELSKQHPFVVFWQQSGTNLFRYSLRSSFGSTDVPAAVPVSLVAGCYGGGGHHAAAGFAYRVGPSTQVMRDGAVICGELLSAHEMWAAVKAGAAHEQADMLHDTLRHLRTVTVPYRT